ncbi:MAG: HAMP domain-containing histidine kinase [candidate division Zixibacteria bacterium]|nr:HAMP domain-containing histidine kinase [candidate division Zixibacteria bacterium]
MNSSSKNIKFGFIVFIVLVVFCIVQLTWWVIFQISQSARQYDNQIDTREQKIELVAQLANNAFCQATDNARAIASAQIEPNKMKRLLEPVSNNPAVLGYRCTMSSGHKISSGEIDSTFYTELENGISLYFDKQFVVDLLAPNTEDFETDFSIKRNGQYGIWIDENSIKISNETINRLKSDSNRAVKMFTSEGTIFLLVMILGAYLIYRALQRTEELKTRQTNFMHAMTHELKTPLTSIRLYLETLQSGNIDSSKTEVIYSKMIVDCNRLDEMVDDVLGASRLDSIKTKMELSDLNLSNELNDYLNSFDSYINQQNAVLNRKIEDGIIIRANNNELNRAIKVLIENGLKYSPPERKIIDVRLTSQYNRAKIVISDQGIGIENNELNKIFDRFYRITNSDTETIRGTGLGLFMAKQTIKSHNGIIKVQSAGRNKGTTFTVELPMVSK